MKIEIFTLFSKWRSIFLLFALLFLWQLPYSQAADNFPIEKMQLEEAFFHIGKEYGVFFNYDREIVADVTVEYESGKYQKVESALQAVFRQTHLQYQIFDQRFVAVYQDSEEGIQSMKDMISHFQGIVDEKENVSNRSTAIVPPLSRQSLKDVSRKRIVFSVNGTVTDEGGEPLIGVNIQVKGSTKGTSTDFDGNFTLEDIDENAVLVVSYVGYQAQEIAVSGKSNLEIVMVSDSQLLDEVVVVGYGTQKRERISSSIATVDESKFLKGPVTKSPLQLLQGKVAGLAISRSGGGDPNAGVQMQLRGVNTVNGDASPLIIIDGMPGGDLNTVLPEDISSIDVLRDGSAAAIYGSRGNNGVVIITTKSGSIGKPKIKLSSYLSTETWLKKPRMLSSAELRQAKKDFGNSRDVFLQNLASNILDLGSNTDWLDVISRDMPLSNVNHLSFSGGTESTTYYSSIGFRNFNGLIKNSNKKELVGRINLTHTGLNDKLIINFNMSGLMGKSKPTNYDVYLQALDRNPTFPIYNEDGSFHEFPGHNRFNPLGQLEQFERNEINNDYSVNFELSYEIIRGLNVSSLFSGNLANKYNNYYQDRKAYASIIGGYEGMAEKSTFLSQNGSIEPMISYSTNVNRSSSLNIITGYSYQINYNEGLTASNRGFISDLYQYNNLGAGELISRGKWPNPVSSSKLSNELIAVFGRINYSFNDKYLFSASVRREGSSKFGPNNKWGTFPAISLGWIVSQESFMADIKSIDFLKIRGGFGTTGNQGIPEYIPLNKLSPSSSMLYNNNWVTGYAPSSNANPNIRWERKREFNLGIDITLFKIFNFNIDVYERNTMDLLYEHEVPVPPNLYNKTWANLGEINNSGIEISTDVVILNKKNLSWGINANYSYNKNKLISLSNDDFKLNYLDLENLGGRMSLSGVYAYRLEEGRPIGEMFGWKFAGFDDNGKWLFWDADNKELLDKNNVKYEDKRVIGNGLPKSWIGLNNNFRFNNFHLDFTFRGALGFDILNTQKMWWGNITLINANNLFKSTVDNIELRDGLQYSDYYIEQGDYLKLDNLSFGYDFKFNSNRSIYFYLTGSNLLTLTRYSGSDPEMRINGLVPSIDYHAIYPSTKIFSFGVNLTL